MDTQERVLIQVSCSTSDGMRGGFISLTVTRLGETVRVASEGQLSHQQALATRSWEADHTLMDDLFSVLSEAGFEAWDKLPAQPSAPISDGMSQSVTARFSDGRKYSMYLWQGPEQLRRVYQALLTTMNRHDPERRESPTFKPSAPLGGPTPSGQWYCPKCMTKNHLNFCSNCGAPRPH